ncbi:MAG: terminase large subunit [Rhodospirillaceae bacterium]|nr:terminase large subunit [Rhodospirillaceae bacterium]
MSAADRTRRYLRGLVIGQGRHAGEPFEVLRWQSRFLRGALAEGVSESALSVARGGGKSTLTAGIACAALDGPLAEPAAEVLIVASSHEQGQIVFRHVQRFLAAKIEAGEFRMQDTVNTSRLTHRKTGTMLSVKGSDPKRLHGAAPSLTICDEVAMWPTPRVDAMLAALRTAAGKVPNARLFMIGTRPADEAHPFAVALREADYSQCHAARPGDSPFARATWRRANPSLDHMPDLEAAIRREAKAAKRDPSLLASFKALRLNMGVADTEQATLLEAGTWAAIEGRADRIGAPVWGLDLGTSAAQSAVAAFWPDSGRLEVMAAFPWEPSLHERGLRDGVGNLYLLCADRGELIRAGQRAVELELLFRQALRRFGAPAAIAADRWRDAEAFDALNKAGVPLAPFESRGQGYKDGAEDVRAFRRACLEGRVAPVESLLLRHAMSEARVVMDPAGNAKLAKMSEGGRRLRARDDAAAAAIVAVALGSRRGSAPLRRPLRSAIVDGAA